MQQRFSSIVHAAMREAGTAAEQMRALDAKKKTSLVAGTAAGVASAAGVAGTAILTGTTATGVAISSLHGAACTSAVLSALGGGSLAAGGLGMAGGAAVLGASCAIPAIVVASLVAHGAMQKPPLKSSEAIAKLQSRITDAQKLLPGGGHEKP